MAGENTFEYHNPDLFVGVFFSGVSLLLTLLTGAAYDGERGRRCTAR